LTRPNRSTHIADRLKGKVALVVGAGSIGPGWGNGKATAIAFAREGARVFCADINLPAAEETVGIIRGEGGEALAHRADVSKAADVAAMIEACVSAYDRIDVLDNNVGIAEVGGLDTARPALGSSRCARPCTCRYAHEVVRFATYPTRRNSHFSQTLSAQGTMEFRCDGRG
jgi:NAD(P)-dependent dehydrogenase (short-subunit alcohol dehydrogenase family)